MDNEVTQSPERLLAEFEATSDEEWLAAAEKLLKGKPFEKVLQSRTYEGITLQPQYRKEIWERIEHLDELPGKGNYVRGSGFDCLSQYPWKVAQEIPYPCPAELNEAILHDLQRGQDALNILIDKAGLYGLDPDFAPENTIGRNGTSISNLADMEQILAGIQLDCVGINIQAYNQALEYAMLLAAYCQKHDIDIKKVQGCIGADPLGQLAERGVIPCTLEEAYGKMAGLLLWAKETGSPLRVIDVHAQIYHNAGGSAVEELTFALATGVEYIRAMQSYGLDIDDIASRMQFTIALGGNLFMEIAKLRAARLLWSRIVSEFGGSSSAARMYIHGRTGIYNKTKYDPWVNMLRTTTEAFAGITGGVNSMHVGAFDEVIREPDEFSRRIARNQQIILAEESHLDFVSDAAGGSWYLEELTRKLAETVWENFQILESEGSMSELLQSGEIQKTISRIEKMRHNNLATRKDVMVGINMYANAQEKPLTPRLRDCQTFENKRISEIQSQRRKEMKIERCAYSIRDAFLAGATIGVIQKKLYSKENTVFMPLEIRRAAKPYEILRQQMYEWQQKTGKNVKAFLANFGSIEQYKARAEFSRGFFELGGFEVIEQGGFATAAETAAAALESGAEIVIICSSDANYPDIVSPICAEIKKTAPKILLILAGYPADLVETFRKEGIDEFIHIKANALDILTYAQRKTGVIL